MANDPNLQKLGIKIHVFSLFRINVLIFQNNGKWRGGVMVITTAQLQSTKPEFRFCAGLNPARSVLENRDGEDL